MKTSREWAKGCWHPLELGPGWEKRLTANIEAAVAAAVAARDEQAREEIAAALQGKNPPLSGDYIFDPIALRVKIRQSQAAAVAAEREALQKDYNSLLKTAAEWEDDDYRWGYVAALKDAIESIRFRARASGGNGGGEA